ncbi:MFS transporter [Burkholderia sp. Ax-1719]|uniref:MFS transporter n=1 Tax=Burkholderia sp. Ax-1719 TaxID=2608334 RepID=UPI001F045748|nr:MFS transporter [Burkholderia sp. Ax-1719]
MSAEQITQPTGSRMWGALTLYALTVATFFGASSAPTPLYRLYQEAWGFSPAMLTLVFASYAFSLLAALLTTGSLSDHIGRRPVIVGSIVLEMAAMLVFVESRNVSMLIGARLVQGFATGAATSALGAAILDESRASGPLINALASLLGMGCGALGASMLVAYAPLPRELIFIVLGAILLLEAGFTVALPETVSRVPGAIAALVPRVTIPRAARGAMLRVAPVNIAVWALGGFYLSLGPSLARAVTGAGDATIGGWVVFALTTGGFAAILALRKVSTVHVLRYGATALAVGLLITLAGVHVQNATVFFAGTAVAGTGFGAAFQGALRSVMPLAQAHERAGLMAAFYILSYLAFSIPAILAGTLAHIVGLRTTTDAYGAVLVALSLTTLLASGTSRNVGLTEEGK